MGREIRRVPPGWEHPRDERGRLQPMHDSGFVAVAAAWIEGLRRWEAGEDPDRARFEADGRRRYYWEWVGEPPDRAYYKEREWAEGEATCFQIYETVSEGTPISPVFSSLDDLVDWLVGQGLSFDAAQAFAQIGSVPSMVIMGGLLLSNYDVAAAVPKKAGE